MATAHASGFAADKEEVWAALLKLAHKSGYTVVQSDDAAKQVVLYVSSGNPLVLGQIITASVSDLGDSEALVSIHAETEGNVSDPFNLAGSSQRKIIAYLLDGLGKSFPSVADGHASNAPKATGCAVILAALLAGAGSTFFLCGFSRICG